MDFVLDANVIMSMLISGRASYKHLLSNYQFFTPAYVLQEVEEYHAVLRVKSRLQGPEWEAFARFIFTKIHVIPAFLIHESNRKKALALTNRIDVDDAEYVALALQFNFKLLTRDVPLHDGLQKKGFRNVILFADFLKTV